MKICLLPILAALTAAQAETNMIPKTRAPLPTPAEIAKLPPDGGPEFNRLIHERSPYLLQHARNPVDWFPWGPEAFAKAKRENKTIFLSVGYSSCHWCHVMEHESFEDAGVAKILNELFVPVKVDREERPDLDDIYMAATQLMTGHGGWPNSVWLMPDGRPWYAGTYFPREDSFGRPGFKSILLRLSNVWTNQNAAAVEQAEVLSAAIRENASITNRPYSGPLDGIISNTFAELAESYDPRNGGFGSAPKFPPHASLLLLLESEPNEQARKMISGTLDAMMLGGIHDHIGGGFARYSTDARWFLPHFEKMLYDNGQLAKIYALTFVLTSNKTYAATARDICDWVLREMTGPEGGFYSALDADSEGVEGKFYVWSRAEILQVLGEADGGLFCRAYNIEERGNYHEEATGESTGQNIPFLTKPITADADKLAACREKLRAVRAKRVWPMLDDKVLTAWNGLMIGGLAVAGKNLNEPRYTAAAERCAKFLLATMWKDGQLLRSYRAGKAAIPGYLDDYANLADGLLDLADATGKAEYREAARKIANSMVSHFYDTEHGGFFTTAPHHEKLITRQKDSFDQAAPSGNGIAAIVLLRLSDKSNNFRKLATETIRVSGEMLRRAPTGCGSLVRALAMAQATQPKSEALAVAETEHVRAELFIEPTTVAPDATVTGRLVLNIAEKFHINANPAANAELIPTTLTLSDHRAIKLLPVDFPSASPKKDLSGRVEIPLKLRVDHAAKEEPVEVVFNLRFQPCDATACLRPATLALRAMLEVKSRP